MIIRFTRMHTMLSLLYSAEFGNNFLVLKDPTLHKEERLFSDGSHCQASWLMSQSWWHITPWILHMNGPSLSCAVQQGKLMQWDCRKGREMGHSLSSDSPFEQPPRPVKRYVLCQKVYFKYAIKIVELCSKKIGYGSLLNLISTTAGEYLHMT